MNFIKTNIEGVLIIEPKVYVDDRGYFFESYNQSVFEKAGIRTQFVQDNQSLSSYAVIRGLHFQRGEFAQAKLVRVLHGKVLDVAVDIRPESTSFGEHVAVELSAENYRQLYIPRGFAHGFSVLSKDAIFAYKCDQFYNKESEGTILYNDPTLNIDWQIDLGKAIVADKDKQAKCFHDAINHGS